MIARSTIFIGLAACLALAAAARAESTTPMAPYANMQGVYACTDSDGQSYTETVTRPLDGRLMRATDTVNGKVDSEHTLGYDNASRTWFVFESTASGRTDVLKSETGSDRIYTIAGYGPNSNVELTISPLTPTSYVVRMDGTKEGKAMHWRETCKK